jgi:aspartyl-tRNA(Asn)/glutamyl-tRNA(Gln) amidotransferase subunit A
MIVEKITDLTLYGVSEKIRKKEISVVDVTKACIARIAETEGKIESFITVCEEDALINADRIQKKIDAGENLSPLTGIPMALKDNICTKGIRTTCASKMLFNFIPPYDATVSKKLKSHDAILLGKVNLDEFAMGGSTENSYFKKTKNPWDLTRVPGGSSGGSCSSVSSGQAFFSLGSDTGGSVRQPASLCGVVGLKPTYGLVSRFGLIAFASSLDQIGPITKDVRDCSIVLNHIAGHDPKDSTSSPRSIPDYTQFLKENIRGLKIGVPMEYLGDGIDHEVKEAILKSCQTFRSLGAFCEEFHLPITEYAIPSYYLVSSAEASSNLARYDGIKYGFRSQKFDDITDLYNQTRSEGFGAEVKRRIMLGTYALSSGYYDAYYNKALKARTLIKESFDKAFEKFDIILGPTSPSTAFRLGEKTTDPLQMYLMDIYTVSVNIAGLPAISIPCGFDASNLPIGLQLIGKPFDEGTLLQTAYAYEQNTNFHTRRPNLEGRD